MMPVVTFIAAALTLAIGLAVFRAHPRRQSNRAFLLFSLNLTLWLACVIGAMFAGTVRDTGGSDYLELWFRANAFFASFTPWSLTVLKNAIIQTTSRQKSLVSTALPFLYISTALAVLTFSESFVLADDQSQLQRGTAYYTHSLITALLFTLTAIQIGGQVRKQQGIRRLEVQYLALICGVSVVLITLLNILGNYLHNRALNRASLIVVVIAYLFMAWALAHHRIFNARQVVTAVAHRMLVLGVLVAATWLLAEFLQSAMTITAAWVLSTLLSGSAVMWLGEKSRSLFGLDDERLLAGIRTEIIGASQVEAGAGRLTGEFEQLLARHYGARFAAILSEREESYQGNGISIARHRAGLEALRGCVWITPESLQRRRPTPALEDLADILRENSLGVAITVPRGSPSPTSLVVIGVKTNEWPFTYPEIRRLQTVAELMDSILTRSRLTDQAALQTRLEHLAMMSRGLAHDLKNLITPVSSFLVHTEGQYAAGSPAADVHSAAQRSVRIMTEYVREALFFADNLKPRLESVEPDKVLEQVREATAPRAAERKVSLVIEAAAPTPMTADGVLLQRLLVNLVNNAVDASTPGQQVRIAVGSARPGWRRFQVVDEGVGIAPDLREKIFEPYFTTKEFGEQVRGFGLGLTIAQKIAHLHAGRISVESTPGMGTTFTVDLPATPELGGATAPLAPAPQAG